MVHDEDDAKLSNRAEAIARLVFIKLHIGAILVQKFPDYSYLSKINQNHSHLITRYLIRYLIQRMLCIL